MRPAKISLLLADVDGTLAQRQVSISSFIATKVSTEDSGDTSGSRR